MSSSLRKAQPAEPQIRGLDAGQVQTLIDQIGLLVDHAQRMQNTTAVHSFAQVLDLIKKAAQTELTPVDKGAVIESDAIGRLRKMVEARGY